MDHTGEPAYRTAGRVIRSGHFAVCVPCIDAEGDPAILTSGYSFPESEHIDFDDEQTFFMLAIICCGISNETVRAAGATPLADL